MIVESPVREKLQPYLPRLELEWLSKDPERLHLGVDGSVVFVDISGFTRLSERLAKLGRVGAEEMAHAIDGCFTDLLAVAYEEGGSLIKFGGDALLLLFEGDDPEAHAGHAARAAHGMRARLRTAGKLRTAGGRVDLRMSVGAHSGRFDFFLVGGSHRELVVTGPAASEAVRMEGTADPGEIVISRAMASLLPALSTGHAKEPGFLLRSAPPGERIAPIRVLAAIDDDLLRGAVPVATRDSLLEGVVEPEHRRVTVAFLHFEGTDAVVEQEGPDALAVELDRLVRDTQEAVDEFGICFLGSDVDADGGKLILAAGAPRAMGDDEERMLLALRRIVGGERRIPIRLGVNRGPVFAGDIGPPYRRTYTVMGDTVNLAARLMAAAAPGEIYATAQVLDLAATRFLTTELEPFLVKGKARPVSAWSVGPAVAAGRDRVLETAGLLLVGRAAEMDALREALAAARAGSSRLVELTGEAGIGKSRLVHEVRGLTTGFTEVGATSEAFIAVTPYAAWRDMLRGLTGLQWDDTAEVVGTRLRELVDANAPSLRPWLPLIAAAADAEMAPTPQVADLGAEFVRPKLHEVVVAFLRAVATGPTLFVLEDAHFMDEASVELLAAVATGGEGRPWLFVVCRRPEANGFRAPDHPAVRRLEVAALDAAAAVELAHAATEDSPIQDHALREVAARAAGNPELLLDLLQAMAAGQEALPDSVEAAATVRIDALAPADRSLVRRLSVFGLAFHPRFAKEVLDPGTPPPETLTWQRLAEFFEDEAGGYLRFRRAVIRDAAYAGLSFRTRRRLHAAVGSRIEREADDPNDQAGLLGMHFSLANEDEKALRYARIAAQRAADLFANVEAVSHYRVAIESGRRAGVAQDEVLVLLEALGEVLWRARLHRDALRVNADARKLARSDPLRLAGLMMKRSMIEEMTGRPSRSLTWLTRARTLLAGDSSVPAMRLLAEVDARYASTLQLQGRNRETVVRAQRAIEEGERSGSRTALGYGENVLGIALTTLGRSDAMEHFQRAVGHFEELGDLRGQAVALANMGAGRYFEGRWSEAVELYERAAEIGDRLGDPVISAAQRMNVGEVLVDQGFAREAEAAFREASRVWRATGEDWGLGFCLTQLGRVAALAGRTEEAVALLGQARERYQLIGAPGQVLEVDAREVECRLLAGETDQVLPRIDEITAGLNAEGGVNVLLVPLVDRLRGYAFAQLGRLDEARQAFEESVAHARERGADHEVALSLQGLARVARRCGEDSTGIERETGVIFDRLGIRAVPVFPLPPP